MTVTIEKVDVWGVYGRFLRTGEKGSDCRVEVTLALPTGETERIRQDVVVDAVDKPLGRVEIEALDAAISANQRLAALERRDLIRVLREYRPD